MGKYWLLFLLFGVIIPFAAYRLKRRIGFRLLLALSIAAGLAYGALKSENPWTSQAVVNNAALMLASALVVCAYIALGVGAASLVGKAVSSLRR
jgi:hypothetical protein